VYFPSSTYGIDANRTFEWVIFVHCCFKVSEHISAFYIVL
jgi:hypothetical protein